MSLIVHRAERTDVLADGLGELLSTSGLDPLAEEVVVVPARGVERWLAQRLSHRLGSSLGADRVSGGSGVHRIAGGSGDGVCAGIRFLTPTSLVALLTGRERDDPWHPDRLAWPVLQAIDAGLDKQWASALAAHLGHRLAGEEAEVRAGRRYAVARRLAGLFASYAVQRPSVLTDWRHGRDLDGAGSALDSDLAWQPQLWRGVLDLVDADPPDVRHVDTLARLSELTDGSSAPDLGLDLPHRLSLFGHTRLPITEIELLGALGRRRDVHLWLPQVSARLWADLEPLFGAGAVPRGEDTSGDLVTHPLLASLGRDSRELERALVGAGALAIVPAVPTAASRADEPVADPRAGDERGEIGGDEPGDAGGVEPGDAGGAGSTLLSWLQYDLRADRPPDADDRAARLVSSDDQSVQVHACHGPARQVEVLREVLVGLLADDPSLEPRDIIVMCPDIESYAPLVQAGFGLADGAVDSVTPPGSGGGAASAARHPAHQLRVRLADRSLTGTNPLADVATRLINLVGGRMTVSEVLDLAASEPVRRRFGFADDDLDSIGRWVEQAAVRWGFDAPGRALFGLQHVGQNTWRFGLDRLLLGVAVSQEGDALGAALPVDDVAGGDIDLVGRFTEFVERLGAVVARLLEARVAADWMGALGDGVAQLTDVDLDDAWQVAELDREFAAVTDAGDPEIRLRLADVRGLLERRFAGRPTRANFRTGTLTVATMVPMRSVPHRVVALLGLDDGVFPRSNTVDGDDVLARRPLTGERDPRSEDRQLLLDAVMAATEHLVITYAGAGEHTGQKRPPAVPLSELIDAVRECATLPRDIVVRHPLQPFDPDNFVGGSLQHATAFSFDAAALAGARAAAAPRTTRSVLLESALPARPLGDVDLADLIAFYAHPARDFLRSRLDVTAPLAGDDPLDAMPVALAALEKWSVGDRLLADALRGTQAASALAAERLRGLLPPRALAEPVLDDVGRVVGALVEAAAPVCEGMPTVIDIDIDIDFAAVGDVSAEKRKVASGQSTHSTQGTHGRQGATRHDAGGPRRLLGTVTDVFAIDTDEPRHVLVGYSSLSPKRRLESWLTVLALTVARPDIPWRGYVLARRGARVVRLASGPVAPAEARRHLLDLIDIYDRARREPLPMPSRTAFAYAEAFLGANPDTDPAFRARDAWLTQPERENAPPGECDDPWNARVYGRGADLDVLLSPPRPDETWNAAPTRLGQYAVRVWEPVLRGGQEIR